MPWRDKIPPARSAAAATTLQQQQLINNRIHFIYRTNANRLTSKKNNKNKKQKTKTVSACIYKASDDVDTGLGPRSGLGLWNWNWNLLGRSALALVHLTEQNVRRDIYCMCMCPGISHRGCSSAAARVVFPDSSGFILGALMRFACI